jgi:ATP-dependent DNA helicase RecG
MDSAALLAILSGLLHLPREQGTVEFKASLDVPEDIGQYISALANTAALQGHERAWVVWGVADRTHEVVGTNFDPFSRKTKAGSNEALIMWLQHMTQPRADFSFHEVRHPYGRVVMLEIHAARSAPVAFQHVRYIRVDSHKVKLADHPDKEARLWAQLGQKDDWSGEVVHAPRSRISMPTRWPRHADITRNSLCAVSRMPVDMRHCAERPRVQATSSPLDNA